MFVGPASADPASGLTLNLFSVFRPYLETLYLNHGYRFFAPEPGPSHLIRFEMTLSDSSKKMGYFPDAQQLKPRLRYHRHFMLTEHLAQFTEDGSPPVYLETFCKSYAMHLLDKYSGTEVKLVLMRHLLPAPEQVLEGMKLNDPSLYFERDLGVYSRKTENLPASEQQVLNSR